MFYFGEVLIVIQKTAMFHIIYVSYAVTPFSQPELEDLLAKARKHNLEVGITGILFYRNGNFLQVMEGEEAAVKALYASIRRDTRHRAVTTLFEEPIAAREFADWSMAFRDLDRNPEQIPEGFNDLFNQNVADMDLKAFSSKVRVFISEMCDL